ncbi:hypothetical protein CEP52_004103 [Fusarium oligoseptatum]|uniref:Methyltransferase type 11 domain-containing protein n=1 Tax=Fusarium oligoseptatum TaxID=2604345 RepID=A0A428U5D5_9HYPO|nr:hypothetical protein CEP52_004103 [Fusarium oligoseptatum]
MSSEQENIAKSQSKSLPFPDYFSALAANYAQQTGNATRTAFNQVFNDFHAIEPVTKDSVVHDNAAGPGTATSVLVDRLPAGDLPQILVTDNVPPMVQAAKDSFTAWPTVETRVLDSQNLEGITDEHFTHSVLNFSAFTFADPLKGLKEIHRTLKSPGLAALLVWKRFGAGEVIHAAQALVRPDLPPMKIPNPQFMEEGYLKKITAEAGFDSSKMQMSTWKIIVKGPELDDGLKKFILSDFTRPARAGWTDEEVGRWPEAVDKAIQKEIDAYGGVKFETWVVLARK